MSWHDRGQTGGRLGAPLRSARRVLTIVGLGVAIGAAGCTVRPLYSTSSVTPTGVAASEALRSISVNAVKTRYAQEVRNQLIFLLGRGAGQPADPEYLLELNVSQLVETSNIAQVTNTSEPSAGTVTLTSRYTLTDVAGKPVTSGQRQIFAHYDVPRQEFAAVRALRDAENRAARELAQALQLALAQDLAAR